MLSDMFWFWLSRATPADWFKLPQGSRRQAFVAWVYDKSHAAAKKRFKPPYLA